MHLIDFAHISEGVQEREEGAQLAVPFQYRRSGYAVQNLLPASQHQIEAVAFTLQPQLPSRDQKN